MSEFLNRVRYSSMPTFSRRSWLRSDEWYFKKNFLSTKLLGHVKQNERCPLFKVELLKKSRGRSP
jgi:hypothetical protein